MILSIDKFIISSLYLILIYTSIFITSILFYKVHKSHLRTTFIKMQIATILWLLWVFYILAFSIENVYIKCHIKSILVYIILLLYFDFTYTFGKRTVINRRKYNLLFALCIIFYILILHISFYKDFIFTLKEDTLTKIYFVNIIFGYIIMIFSNYFLAIGLKKNIVKINKFEKVIYINIIIIPFIINTINIVYMPYLFDLTPVVFNLSIIYLIYIAYKYELIDTKYVVRHVALDKMYEGIIILDKNNRIIKYNQIVKDELSQFNIQIKEKIYLEEAYNSLKKYIRNINEANEKYKMIKKGNIINCQFELEIEGKALKTFLVKIEKIVNKKNKEYGTCLRFVSFSKYKNLLNELERKNNSLAQINEKLVENVSVTKRLIISKEHNRISKEVHDILGHSMTLVISLLETSKIYIINNPHKVRNKIIQAMKITRSGLTRLKKSLSEVKDDGLIESKKLIEELNKLIEEYETSGVKAEFIVNDMHIRLEPIYFDTIYRLCQESLTNSLKHGKATEVMISIRFSKDVVDIIIIDNGRGCKNFTKGYGINGMEQRVKELDGHFFCGSPEGEGFNIHAVIPFDD